MEVTKEQFARAILHGWENCEPYYHMSLNDAYARLLADVCDKSHCLCKEDPDPLWTTLFEED